jgi:uncharacterized MAPEG superfamily protein
MNELQWLAATCLMTALFWPIYVLNRMAVQGVWRTMDNPKPDDPPLAPWAERAHAAHKNAVENLVVFAPLVVAAHALGVGAVAAQAAAVYCFARLAHFLVYTAGIPVARTLTFSAAWAAQIILAWAVLGRIA